MNELIVIVAAVNGIWKVEVRETRETTKSKGDNMSRLVKNQRGQGLVEYALALVLMALLTVGAVKYLGTQTHNAFSTAGDSLKSQMSYSSTNGTTSEAITSND